MKLIDILPLLFCVMLIVILGIICHEVTSANDFCKSKGYDYYHFDTENGWIACCKLKDHMKTNELCDTFKFKGG